ncbi:MAG: hypothetical protein JF616_13285 [Fibrobacteres bacterium]|jgi:hypothetical protein|nr:hypothetical protein [Fibrobacterota bacterium]
MAKAQSSLPGSSDAQGDDGNRAAILELTDTALIASAWHALFADSSQPPTGEYVALIPSAPGGSDGFRPASTVHLIRNGTELGHFDRATWDDILLRASAGRRKWAAALEGPEKQDVPLAWEAGKWDGLALLEKAEWPGGFVFGIGSTFSAVRSSKPQYQRDFEFAWNQKLFTHFLLGASLHRSQFGGGLTRIGQEVADTAGGKLAPLSYNPFWGDGYWWWTFSVGVPALRYTLALADQPLPRYFWMESRSTDAIRTHSQGRLVSQWKGDKLESSGNLSQSVDARFGILRYGILFDFDAYRVPVQTVGCEDLPALFGTWGAGLILASDVLATRAWLDIPDAALSLDVPRDWPTHVRIAFLRLEFDYRNQKSFSLGLSVRLNIQNPIMNLPRTRS